MFRSNEAAPLEEALDSRRHRTVRAGEAVVAPPGLARVAAVISTAERAYEEDVEVASSLIEILANALTEIAETTSDVHARARAREALAELYGR